MDETTARTIPLPIQREVRRRCGFGCVVCGLPLYEYDHLYDFTVKKSHRPEEIALLCDLHHREKTSTLLPLEDVLAANQSPFNLREGVSKPYDLHFTGDECEAVIGSNRFLARDEGYGTQVVPISVDDTPLLGFILADGHLLLNLNVFDDCNALVLRIVNNVLAYSVSPWDIQFVGRRLIIREAARQILIDILFEPPNRIIVRRGRFLRNGVEVLVTPDYLLVTNNNLMFAKCEVAGGNYGLMVGPHKQEPSCAVRVASVPRYLGDRAASKKWADEAFSEAETLLRWQEGLTSRCT